MCRDDGHGEVTDLKSYRRCQLHQASAGKDPGTAATGPPENDGRTDVVTMIVELKKRSSTVRRALGLLPAWVTPNGVTVFRMLLMLPAALFLRSGQYWLALAVLVFATLLDFVDGALASVRGTESELGAFLDPLADKVIVCGTLLLVIDRLPMLLILPIGMICLCAAGLTGLRIYRSYLSRQDAGRPRRSVAAKPAGKMKMIAETLTLFLLVVGLGTGSGAVILVAGIGLLAAAVLGGLSLYSQLS